MGKWILYKNRDSFQQLVHLNLLNGVRTECGLMRADTPLPMILKWIVNSGSQRPGDLLLFHGQPISISSSEARA